MRPRFLGLDTSDIAPDEAGAGSPSRWPLLLRDANMPNGLTPDRIRARGHEQLVEGTLPQHRVTHSIPDRPRQTTSGRCSSIPWSTGRRGRDPEYGDRPRRLLAGDVEFDEVSRALYATDAGLNQIAPLGVVAPRDTEDVVRLVEYAGSRGLPLVPRGMGSGLAGGAVGPGIQVDFTRYMNRVLKVADDATWVKVNRAWSWGPSTSLKRTRYYWPNSCPARTTAASAV